MVPCRENPTPKAKDVANPGRRTRRGGVLPDGSDNKLRVDDVPVAPLHSNICAANVISGAHGPIGQQVESDQVHPDDPDPYIIMQSDATQAYCQAQLWGQ